MALRAGLLGSWVLDLASGELNSSERFRAIFGRADEQRFTYADLQASVHPDDRQSHAGRRWPTPLLPAWTTRSNIAMSGRTAASIGPRSGHAS